MDMEDMTDTVDMYPHSTGTPSQLVLHSNGSTVRFLWYLKVHIATISGLAILARLGFQKYFPYFFLLRIQISTFRKIK